MRIKDDVKLDYSDVMLLPACNPNGPQSRSDVKLDTDGVIPVIAANMDGVGTFEMAYELAKHGMITALHKHHSLPKLINFFMSNDTIHRHAIYSMGISEQDFLKFDNFWVSIPKSKMPIICIDVANGYTKETAEFIDRIKTYNVTVMAGNVVTPEGMHHLYKAGADIIKIGIGPGSVCTTRKLTGIGYPQFSAVLECVQAAKNLPNWYGNPVRVPKIVADGGITCPGDIAKALAAGADYVMIGGMFAGHDEGLIKPVAEHISIDHTRIKGVPFHGMASKAAQHAHNGGVAEYRASEGKEVFVPYRGPVKSTILEILGGLRSSCAYQGVMNLSDISKEPEFIRVNQQLNNVFGS